MPAERTGGAAVILIVEDHDDTRSMVRSVLATHGYHALEASSGPEALRAARTLRPDLILLDLGLPGMNGLDVAQLLNQSPETASTPLVALTGSWLGSDPAALAGIGFVGALRKPFRSPELLAEVARVLQGEEPAGRSDSFQH
jgi:CheY-like chemotaxis protein